MLRQILSYRARRLKAGNENLPACERGEAVPASNIRALATEAALATAVDTSAAVLVPLFASDHYHQPRVRRRSPMRRAS
ncbi:MAG TPA: hypothetical protein VG900_10380 [Hyphomicrobiaceae bacterium]|jgi:hypothetical protein|nr:hypothetical protein [Hyphomicrobiaceae bacterium]